MSGLPPPGAFLCTATWLVEPACCCCCRYCWRLHAWPAHLSLLPSCQPLDPNRCCQQPRSSASDGNNSGDDVPLTLTWFCHRPRSSASDGDHSGDDDELDSMDEDGGIQYQDQSDAEDEDGDFAVGELVLGVAKLWAGCWLLASCE